PAALGLFALFAVLDYLDGVVARGRRDPADARGALLGRVLDRLTDSPMLLVLGAHAARVVPLEGVLARLGFDLVLLALFVAGRGSTENRVRTALSYALLLALLFVGRGWAPASITPGRVVALLWVSVAFNALVALHNLGVLPKRRFADALSAANLACGGAAMVFVAGGRTGAAIACLLGSALFDGLDGAAARRWGGSRFGVWADDVADALSYGVAPAFALGALLGGGVGVAIGVAYAASVFGRLAYFTWTGGVGADGSFRGAPSTVGAVLVYTSLHLFGDAPALVGACVGGAVVAMSAFDVPYRHLGRVVERGAAAPMLWAAVPAAVVLAAVAAARFGPDGPVGLLFGLALAYALRPAARRFGEAWRNRSVGGGVGGACEMTPRRPPPSAPTPEEDAPEEEVPEEEAPLEKTLAPENAATPAEASSPTDPASG
ncbi:MAG TPA: CDP-alcohol phosphatidyltransferase family protein, partial [Polyangiaceae bacterium LLY-WYZ-15_(1-7)]|nr:CDP-alcohol phosphatidyltransferase family protein [Polyangiaceae bacterium LLY-WYZ-15_(1-7)]